MILGTERLQSIHANLAQGTRARLLSRPNLDELEASLCILKWATKWFLRIGLNHKAELFIPQESSFSGQKFTKQNLTISCELLSV